MSIVKLVSQTKKNMQQGMNVVRKVFLGKSNYVDTSKPVQKAQINGLADETLNEIDVMQQFGFTSHLPADTQVVVVPIGGTTSGAVIVASENKTYRVLNLEEGEVAIYDKSGSTITLKKGKVVNINCDKLNITCSDMKIDSSTLSITSETTHTGNMNFTGAVSASGEISSQTDLKSGARSFNSHVHKLAGGGDTLEPK